MLTLILKNVIPKVKYNTVLTLSSPRNNGVNYTTQPLVMRPTRDSSATSFPGILIPIS